MRRQEAKKANVNKPRTATIYNVEIERRLVTEHNFEKAIYNLSKLARLKEITTVEIVLDTIQQSIELALFGCKVELAVVNDQTPKVIELYGDKNYTRKVTKGDSGCFKAIERKEIVVEVDNTQATIVFVPLIGPTLVHGVLEIRGLVTNELLNPTLCRRPIEALRNMLIRQDYAFLSNARFWKLEKVASYANIDQPNSSMVMSGRVSEIVETKNGVPFFGGPRYNIQWEDGKQSTELTVGELLSIYQETPQSLGFISVLDDPMFDRLYEFAYKAGSFLEVRKTEIFLHQLAKKLRMLQLNAVGIVEMILQSVPNIITDIREIVFLGFNSRLNEMKTLVNYTPVLSKEKASYTTFTFSAFDIAQSLMKGEVSGGKSRRRQRGRERTDEDRVYSKSDLHSTIWAGIELLLPENFQWSKSSDYTRFFLIFHKKNLRSMYQQLGAGRQTASTNTSRDGSRPVTEENSSNDQNLLLPFDFDVFLGACKQIEAKIALIWKLEQRKRGFRETIKQLESLLLENRGLSLKDIYELFLSNIPQKWLRADIYVGMLKSGANILEYVACNEHSKMLGKFLKRGEGISFDVLDTNRSLIFQATDLDKKRQLSEGCTIGIMYGKKQYMGKLLKARGHDTYDVRYDCDQKVEAGVDLSRIIPLNIAFRIKLFPKAKLPFIAVPIRNRSKCIGILGVDNIDYECLIDATLSGTSNAANAANTIPAYNIDEDLQLYLEQLGRVLGSAIDIKLKKNALQAMYTVAKNQNAELKDLFTAALENLFTCSCYITGISIYEYQVMNHSLALVDRRGELSLDCQNKITHFDLKKYGKKPLQRIGTKSILLICVIKSEDENISTRIYVIGLSCNAPILDVDYEFFNSFQKTLTGLLHNIVTHKASGEYRARALKDIRELCQQWMTMPATTTTVLASPSWSLLSDRSRIYFFQKFCEKIWKVYHAANLYVGILGVHANQIRYFLASNHSQMAGKVLIRSAEQSVSFIAIDKDRPLCILAGSALANQLYHFGEKQSFQYPFVVVPIVADMDTVFGILGIDNSAGEVVTESQGQVDDLMSFYGTVGLSLGKVIRRFRSEDARRQLIEIRRKSSSFVEAVTAIRKLLLEYLPFANRIVDLSFRPGISKVTLKQEFVLFFQIQSLQIYSHLLNSPLSNRNGNYRLVVFYRGHPVGEIYPINATSSSASSQGSKGGTASRAIQAVMKVVVPEGITSDNVKLFFKLIHTTPNQGTMGGLSSSISRSMRKYNNQSSTTPAGGASSHQQRQDEELAHKFLSLNYFYHSSLLPYRHTLYNIETVVNAKSSSVGRSLEAELADFQMTAKLEEANQVVAVTFTSTLLKLDLTTSLAKVKGDYQIYIIFLWNGQNLGRTEHVNLDTRLEWQGLDTFLPLPTTYQAPAVTLAAPVSLDMEIWSNSQKSKEDLLGKVSFNVSNLIAHLSRSGSMSASSATTGSSAFQLVQRNVECLPFISNLSIQLQGKIITARDIESDQIPFLLKTADHSTSSQLIPLQVQKSIKNLDNFIQCELSILQIRDLIIAEKFSTLTTYFVITLNNAEVGSTSLCYDPILPQWTDEYFRLLIPTGPEWEELTLSLDLYGIVGQASGPVLIGKIMLRSRVLAETVLSGIMKYLWLDLVVYNSEAFELENNQRAFHPQVLVSARILSAPKSLLTIPSYSLTKELKILELMEFVNIPTQFFEKRMNQFIVSLNEQKILEMKFTSHGSWAGKTRQFRLPAPASKPLIQSTLKIQFYQKVNLRSSAMMPSTATKDDLVEFGSIEITGKELYSLFHPLHLQGIAGGITAAYQSDGARAYHYFPLPESIFAGGLLKVLAGDANGPIISQYDDFIVMVKLLAAQGLPIEKMKYSTNKDNRPNVQCLFYWNHQLLATTPVINHQQNPVWSQDDSYFFRVPIDWKSKDRLGKCHLRLELYHVTTATPGPEMSRATSKIDPSETESAASTRDNAAGNAMIRTLLGCLELRGNDLVQFFSDDASTTALDYLPWYPLEIVDEFASNAVYNVSEQVPSVKLFGCIVNQASVKQQIQDTEYLIEILRAEGLANMDAYGSANAYVEVIFDAKVIGFTQVKKLTMNPLYQQERLFLDLTDKDGLLETYSVLPVLYLRVWSLFPAKSRVFLGETGLNMREIMNILQSDEPEQVLERILAPNAEFTAEENASVQGSIQYRLKPIAYRTADYEYQITELAYLQLCTISNFPRSSVLNTIPKVYVRILRKYLLEGTEWLEVYHSKEARQSFTIDFDQEFIPIQIPTRSSWEGFALSIEILNEWQEVIAIVAIEEEDAKQLLAREEELTQELLTFPLTILDSYGLVDGDHLTEISFRGGKKDYLEEMKDHALAMMDSEENLLVSGKLFAFAIDKVVYTGEVDTVVGGVSLRAETTSSEKPGGLAARNKLGLMVIKKQQNKLKSIVLKYVVDSTSGLAGGGVLQDDPDKLDDVEVYLPNMKTSTGELECLFYAEMKESSKYTPLARATFDYATLKKKLAEHGEYRISIYPYQSPTAQLAEEEEEELITKEADAGDTTKSKKKKKMPLGYMKIIPTSPQERLQRQRSRRTLSEEKEGLETLVEGEGDDFESNVQNENQEINFLIQLRAVKVDPRKTGATKTISLYVGWEWSLSTPTDPTPTSTAIGQSIVIKDAELFSYDNEWFQTILPVQVLLNESYLTCQLFSKNQLMADTILGKCALSISVLRSLLVQSRYQNLSLPVELNSTQATSLGWRSAEVVLMLKTIPDLTKSIYFNPSLAISDENSATVEEIEILIHGFSNLAKLGVMTSTDCFATVRYGHLPLGETTVITDSLNPIWFENQIFPFRFPTSAVEMEDEEKEDYLMTIDVFSYQSRSQKHFYLGSVLFTYDELITMFTKDLEQQCFQLQKPLQLSPQRKLSEAKYVQGIGYFTFARKALEGLETRDAAIQINGARGLAALLPSIAVTGPGQAVPNIYLVLRWNGKIIGTTASQKATATPCWENTRISFHIFDLDLFQDSLLAIELWQSKSSNIVASSGSPDRRKDVLLGSFSMTRKELKDIFDAGTNQNLSRWIKLLPTCSYLPETIQVNATSALGTLPPKQDSETSIELKCLFLGISNHSSLHNQKTYELHLHSIDGLLPIDGSIQNLNVYVICRVNDREIGRSYLIPQTDKPKWENQRFHIALPEEMLVQSVIQLEVMNQRSLLLSDDFLGMIQWKGTVIVNLFTNPQNLDRFQRFPLLDDERMYQNRRRFIRGEIEVKVTTEESGVPGSNGGQVTTAMSLQHFLTASQKELQYHWKELVDSAAGSPVLHCEVLSITLLPQIKAINSAFSIQPIATIYCQDLVVSTLLNPYPIISSGAFASPLTNSRLSIATTSTYQYSWKDRDFSVYYPLHSDFAKNFLRFEIWNDLKVSSFLSAALGATKLKICDFSLSLEMLIRLFHGEFVFPIMIHEDTQPYLWKGEIQLRIHTSFPFWNHCEMIRPTSYRRRITIASANNLPMISGLPPNCRASILVNDIVIAKSSLVQNTCNPTFVRLTTDIDIDIQEEITIAVEIFHVNTWNRKEVLLGGEEIPYEYLIKPPAEPIYAFLRNEGKRDPDFQFALSGSVKIVIQGTNRLDEDYASYSTRKTMVRRRLLQQEQQQQLQSPPSQQQKEEYLEDTSLVKVIKLDYRDKTKKNVVDLKGLKSAQLSDHDLQSFGMINNLTATQELGLNPQWLLLPAMDLGMAIGNPKKKANQVGTQPGSLLSFAIERRPDRLAISDISVLEDLQKDIASTLVHVRRRDLGRRQREKALHFLQELLQRMNALSTADYEERWLWKMLRMILSICFPHSIIRLVRLSKDGTILSYEVLHQQSVTVHQKTSDGKNLQSEKSLVQQPVESTASQMIRLPREYSQKDSQSFGRNFQRSFTIQHPQDLLRQNIILFTTSLTRQQFPRIQANICAEDAVTALVQIEDFLLHQGGIALPMFHTEIEEIQQWLENITMAIGESIFQQKEKLLVEHLLAYMKQWNSSLFGSYCLIVFELQKLLFGYRLLEVINVDAEYRLHGLLEKKPKTEPLYGRRVILRNISLRRQAEEIQSVISGTSVAQSITSSIKNFLKGATPSSSALSGAVSSAASSSDDENKTKSAGSSFSNVWKAAKNLFATKEEEKKETEKDILDKILEEGDDNDREEEIGFPSHPSNLRNEDSTGKEPLQNSDSNNLLNDLLEGDEGDGDSTKLVKEITNLLCGIRYEGQEQLFPIKHNPANNTFSIPSEIVLYMKSDFQVTVSVYEVNEDSFQPLCENSGLLYLSLQREKAEDHTAETKILLSPTSATSSSNSSNTSNNPGRTGRMVYEFCYEWEWDETFNRSAQAYQLDQLEGFRVKILKAQQLSFLKNKKLPNPYCEVLYQGKIITTTASVKSSISPEWNESLFIPINPANVKVTQKNVASGSQDKNRVFIDLYDAAAVVNKGQFLGRISLSFDQLLSYTGASSTVGGGGDDQGNFLELPLDRRKDLKATKQKYVGGKLSFTCKAVFKEAPPPSRQTRNQSMKNNSSSSVKTSSQKQVDPTTAMFIQVNQMKNPHLIVYVDSAHDLPSANRFSNDSDPFSVMFVGKEEISRGKTKTISNTLNPIWDESFEVSLLSTKQNQADISSEELSRLRTLAQDVKEQKDREMNRGGAAAEKKKDNKENPEHKSEHLLDFFNPNIYETIGTPERPSTEASEKGGSGNSQRGKKSAVAAALNEKQSLFLSDHHFISIQDLPTFRFEVYDYNQLTSSILLGKCELTPDQYLNPQFYANASTTDHHQDHTSSVFSSSKSPTNRIKEETAALSTLSLSLSGFKNDFKHQRGKLVVKWKIIDLPVGDEEDHEEEAHNNAKAGGGKKNKRLSFAPLPSTTLSLTKKKSKYVFNEYNGLSALSYFEINLFKINEISRPKRGKGISSVLSFSKKINSYLIVRYQSKVIHQTKMILNNPSPEYNERCSFFFNYEMIYTQIVGLTTASLSRQNSQFLDGTANSGGGMTRKDSMMSHETSSVPDSTFSVGENSLSGLDVTIELWLTDYFNNHECIGEFYLPAAQLLHVTNYEIFNLEFTSKDQSVLSPAATAKKEKEKETITSTSEIEDVEVAAALGLAPKKSSSSFFSLTRQREKQSKQAIKTELTLMINHYRKFPEIHIQKQKYYPLHHKYEQLIPEYSNQSLTTAQQQYNIKKYLLPNYTLSGKPITMIYDPNLENSRYKRDQIAGSVHQLLEKSNQQIQKYYHTQPFEQIGIISELHYGQLCAASRRGEKTVLKGPKHEIYCLPLFPSKQQLIQQQVQLQQLRDLQEKDYQSLASSSSVVHLNETKDSSMNKKKQKEEAVSLNNTFLLQLEQQLFQKNEENKEGKESKAEEVYSAAKLEEEDEEEEETKDTNSFPQPEDSLTQSQLSLVEALSPSQLAIRELALQFYQQNHVYLLARYGKDQLPRKHMKCLEKFQQVLLNKLEYNFFSRYAKQKQLLALYETVQSFHSLLTKASQTSTTVGGTGHIGANVRLEEMVAQCLLEYESTTDCPIKVYLLEENGVDFNPVTIETYADGELSIQSKRSLSTQYRHANHSSSTSDKYDLIAKIILICRYQIILQYYQEELSVIKGHWEQYLPNDLPLGNDVIEELRKLFAGNHYAHLFPPSSAVAASSQSLSHKYVFHNDYYQEFHRHSSTFFEEIFAEIKEQYPRGVLFLPLIAYNEVMMGLLVIKNINISFPPVEYHYSIPEEYESRMTAAPATDNITETPQRKRKLQTTETNEQIFTIEAMEHGIVPILNKSSQLFSENLLMVKVAQAMRTIRSFSLKPKTPPLKYLLFCFWQIIQSIPAIREVSLWMIHRDHIFVERREFLPSPPATANNATSKSGTGGLTAEEKMKQMIASEEGKPSVRDTRTGAGGHQGKEGEEDEDKEEDEEDLEEKQDKESSSLDPFAFLSKLFTIKSKSKAKTTSQSKKSRKPRRGNRSSKVTLTKHTSDRLEGIVAGFFGSENANELMSLNHPKSAKHSTLSGRFFGTTQKESSSRRQGNPTPAAQKGSGKKLLFDQEKEKDWRVDIPDCFQHYPEENNPVQLETTPTKKVKLLNKLFLEKIYREILYCIESRGLTTFSVMTGHTLAVLGKDSPALQSLFLRQIFQIPEPTTNTPLTPPGTSMVSIPSMIRIEETDRAISGVSNEEGMFPRSGSQITNNSSSVSVSASNLSKANSTGTSGGIKKPPLPPGPPPSYANRVAALNIGDAAKSPNSLSPYISPRPPQQPPPTQSFSEPEKEAQKANPEGKDFLEETKKEDHRSVITDDGSDPKKAMESIMKMIQSETSLDNKTIGSSSLPSATPQSSQDRFYFCLSVKTHGIGGDNGWGLIGDQVQRSIADIAVLMEANFLKLHQLQHQQLE